MTSKTRLEDNLNTLTVTIALETNCYHENHFDVNHKVDLQQQSSSNTIDSKKNEFPPDFFRIGPPIKASEVSLEVDSRLQLAHLSPILIKLLELRLNPCSLGTLKNWEYVCASLGASSDEIANLRRAESPTMLFLNNYKVFFLY